ncbi:DUF748 domain-containing protein [Reichenbachiella carrageenanivorans]|uniref:DUF748 domain-containing protein n=1 Tax=Reichenbachiella carrageenanivorans TaxID=2979869 RepID=A0ABY6D6T0_9BACT|nr:DUF748 domain-containing protein [Reichenbachiella carrageenanivorans]UXX80838.1 DUF748 domain-containing protein [Reichenbachiella carrageenanivorans]
MSERKRGLYLLVFFPLVFLGLFVLAQANLAKIIDARLSEQGLEVQSSGTTISLWSRSILLDSLRLSHPSGSQLFCTKLEITGIHLFDLMFKNGFSANTLAVDTLFIRLNMPTDSLDVMLKGTAKPKKDYAFSRVRVGRGGIHYSNADQEVLSLGFVINALQVDSKTGFGEGSVALNQLRYYLPEDGGMVTIDSLVLDLNKKQLGAKKLALTPVLDIPAFVKRFPYQKDRIDLQVASMTLEDLDLAGVFEGGGVKCERVKLDTVALEVFRDKQLKRAKQPDKPLFIDWLKASPLPVSVDTFVLTKASILYKEHYPPSNERAYVSFTQLHATAYRIYSESQLPIVLEAQAVVQHQGRLRVRFDLSDRPEGSRVVGSLSGMELARFNTMSVPAVGMNISKGVLNRMTFDFHYNHKIVNGILDMDYEDLSIQLVDKETKSQNIAQQVGSFMVNTFKVKSSNNRTQKSYNQGLIAYDREPEKSEISLWWKALLSGIKSSVGVEKKKEAA